MRAFLVAHLTHVLCALILLARTGDIVSTYLVTPKLKLEANPIARWLGWKFALLTLFVCLVPYYSTSLSLIVLVPSLLVSASNIGSIWFVRACGETEYLHLLQDVIRKARFSHLLACLLAANLSIALAGGVLMFLCPDPDTDWGFWFAAGMLTYAGAMILHRGIYYRRLFRQVRRADAAAPAPVQGT